MKDLEEGYIHEKIQKYGNKAIEDDFVRSCLVTVTAIIISKIPRKPRSRNRNRTVGKLWWTEVYNNWSDDNFKEKMRIRRDTFNQILVKIRDQIELTPTNLIQFPISPERQLALTMYRLATGCSYATLSGVFEVSVSSAGMFFYKICKVVVADLYDTNVKLPTTDSEWEAEIRGLLENYEFPSIGAWDGFHVQVSSKLESYYSF